MATIEELEARIRKLEEGSAGDSFSPQTLFLIGTTGQITGIELPAAPANTGDSSIIWRDGATIAARIFQFRTGSAPGRQTGLTLEATETDDGGGSNATAQIAATVQQGATIRSATVLAYHKTLGEQSSFIFDRPGTLRNVVVNFGNAAFVCDGVNTDFAGAIAHGLGSTPVAVVGNANYFGGIQRADMVVTFDNIGNPNFSYFARFVQGPPPNGQVNAFGWIAISG